MHAGGGCDEERRPDKAAVLALLSEPELAGGGPAHPIGLRRTEAPAESSRSDGGPWTIGRLVPTTPLTLELLAPQQREKRP
jgi:hypothetical protein